LFKKAGKLAFAEHILKPIDGLVSGTMMDCIYDSVRRLGAISENAAGL
jgi:hypothetical protein